MSAFSRPHSGRQKVKLWSPEDMGQSWGGRRRGRWEGPIHIGQVGGLDKEKQTESENREEDIESTEKEKEKGEKGGRARERRGKKKKQEKAVNI